MSDLFTKTANIKTTTKLWVVGVALLITVNIPFVDNHYQPNPVPTPASDPTDVQPATGPSPTIAEPKTRTSSATKRPIQPGMQATSFSSVTGDYIGSVYNQTAALSADCAIKLQDSNGMLSGFISVKPPLYGSGALKGTTDGKNLVFAVSSDIGTIAFTGVDKGNQITGTYTVQHSAGGQESGSFKLSKEGATNRVAETEKILVDETTAEPSNVSQPEKAPVVAEAPKVITEPSTHSDPKNYSSCMNGLSYACNKALLTPDEAANVQASDLRRNLSSCMSGLSYACNRRLLTPDEASKVKASDLRRNYSSCMNGLSYACNKDLLTPEEAATAAASDLRRNYSSCLNDLSYACNKSLLTREQLSSVQASVLRKNYSACVNGLSYSCDRSLLTKDQLLEVESREQTRKK